MIKNESRYVGVNSTNPSFLAERKIAQLFKWKQVLKFFLRVTAPFRQRQVLTPGLFRTCISSWSAMCLFRKYFYRTTGKNQHYMMLLPRPTLLLTTWLKRKWKTTCIWKRTGLLLPLPKFFSKTTSLLSKCLYSLLYSLFYLSITAKWKKKYPGSRVWALPCLMFFVIFTPTVATTIEIMTTIEIIISIVVENEFQT